MENKHREPTLFIVGNIERKDEIRHILEDEWGGKHKDYTCGNSNSAYFVGVFGYLSSCSLDNDYFKEAVANGWMKEYKLPEKPQFKPFDKVVVKNLGCIWRAAFYSHKGSANHIMTNSFGYQYCLPYNEKTAKLIGTADEWKGGNNE